MYRLLCILLVVPCSAGWIFKEGTYLSDYTTTPYAFFTAASARQACSDKYDCGGITYEPKNNRYTTRKGTLPKTSPNGEVSWVNPMYYSRSADGKYLSGYTAVPYVFRTFRDARVACTQKTDCGGVTYETLNNGRYTTRKGTNLKTSPSGEISWLNPMFGTSSNFGKYLSHYTPSPYAFYSLKEAKQKCSEKFDCGGVTYEPLSGQWTTRELTQLRDSPTREISWVNPMHYSISADGKYLSGYTTVPYVFRTFQDARVACSKKTDCGGITYEPLNNGRYTTRKGTYLKTSPSGEISWMNPIPPPFTSYYGKFLRGYTSAPYAFDSFQSAKVACGNKNNCRGITYEPRNGGRYTTRVGLVLESSPSGEITWVSV